jgi:hypothetical protein
MESCTPTDAESAKSHHLEPLDDFTLLSMLLQLAIITRNSNGDTTMRDFTQTLGSDGPSDKPQPLRLEDEGFQQLEDDALALDALSAVLMQDYEVVATVYQSPKDFTITVVTGPDGTQTLVSDLIHSNPDSTLHQKEIKLKLISVATVANGATGRQKEACREAGGPPTNLNKYNIQLTPKGTSFWPSIRDLHIWDYHSAINE